MYYLLMDYLIPAFDEDEFVLTCPATKKIYEVEQDLTLYVAYYSDNIGRFAIQSESRKKAYQLATTIRSLLGIFGGFMPDDESANYFLHELKQLPQPEWNIDKTVFEIQDSEYGTNDSLVIQLQNGYKLEQQLFDKLCSDIDIIWNNLKIQGALNHLHESRFLFAGGMSGGQYMYYYKVDRIKLTNREMEKRYFENRYRYETAFIAAFKGIERFFGKGQIKKGNENYIKTLDSIDNQKINSNTEYIRYHEIFSGKDQCVSYKDLLSDFIDLRSGVAAHGNQEHALKIIEDNIFEIQLFLQELINKAIRK